MTKNLQALFNKKRFNSSTARLFEKYIQIKDGNVIVTDAHIGLIIPQTYIFEAKCFPAKGEFYISYNDWSFHKMHQANSFVYEKSFLKANIKGHEINVPVLTNIDYKFPPLSEVVDQASDFTECNYFCFDPTLIAKIAKVTGWSCMKFSFTGTPNEDSEGFNYTMRPIKVSDASGNETDVSVIMMPSEPYFKR